MREAKSRKHGKKRNHKALKVQQTVANRERRAENKEKRELMQRECPELEIEIIDGEIHTFIIADLPSEIHENTIKQFEAEICCQGCGEIDPVCYCDGLYQETEDKMLQGKGEDYKHAKPGFLTKMKEAMQKALDN